MNNTLIRIDDLTQAYETGVPVLERLTLEVTRGEVVGLLGRNGAGKTTLLHTLIGVMAAQSGRVVVFGLDPFEAGVEVKKRCGFVAEDQVLPRYLQVEQVLALHRALYPTWDRDLEAGLCQRFAVSRDRRVAQLSKGQARQLALICAMAHRPELLLLDEPAGGLDPALRREFLATAIDMLGRDGTTVLFSSHYVDDVERIASRLVLLEDGRALIDDDLDTVQEGYAVATLAPLDAETLIEIRAVPGCLAARATDDGALGVFRGAPTAVREVVGPLANGAVLDCRTVPLEELFVAIAGGRR